MPFEKIETVSTVEQVIEHLLTVIRLEDFDIGDQFPPERRLAEMLGVSRSTLREAVIALSTIGVLEIARGKGTFVRATDFGETLASKVAELMGTEESPLLALELRVLIEPGIAALAAERRTESDLEEMESSLRLSEARIARNETYFEEDLDFHLAIIRAADNPLVTHALIGPLTIWFGYLKEEIADAALTGPGRLPKYHGLHLDIHQAIKEEDPKQAFAAMERHSREIKEDFLRY